VQERTLTGHTGTVYAVVVTPDGQRAVSASADYTLKVWNLETGVQERTLAGHLAAVNAVALTPTGRWVVSASGDQTLKVWHLETGRILAGCTADATVRCCTVARTVSLSSPATSSAASTSCVWMRETPPSSPMPSPQPPSGDMNRQEDCHHAHFARLDGGGAAAPGRTLRGRGDPFRPL
jgi:WD40 repeat protein